MAQPTSVNDQITDAVTQSNVETLGMAPAQAMATLYQVMSQTAGLAMQNAVAAQQQANILYQAVTTRCVQLLLSLDEAAASDIFADEALAKQLSDLMGETAAPPAAKKPAAKGKKADANT